MVGSPYYAAPEQEKDPDAVDARSDLHAVGVLLYRMLTGHLPDDLPAPNGPNRPSLEPAWYVSSDLGFVGWQDFTCRCYARPVCHQS